MYNTFLLVGLLFLVGFAAGVPICPGENVALRWHDLHKELIKTSLQYPLKFLLFKSVRTHAMLSTAMYDTWALYDDDARPYRATGINKNTVKPSVNPDLNKAISYASYRILSEVYASLESTNGGLVYKVMIDNFFVTTLGYNSTITTLNTTNEAAVGNLVAHRVIQAHIDDGYNAYGTSLHGDGTRYSDITHWAPGMNDPMPFIARANCATLRSINHWQPARVRCPACPGGSRAQGIGESNPAVAKTFALSSPAELRPAPPAHNAMAEWEDNLSDLLTVFANLDDAAKARATFWQNGVNGTTTITWPISVCMNAARASKMCLGETTAFMFGHAMTMWDAFASYNDGKLFWQAPRPSTAVQCTLSGQSITSWKGPYQGVGTMLAGNWSAYLPDTFVQNDSPEYPCGHCTASSSLYQYLRTYFGNDTYVGLNTIVIPAGSSPVEPKIIDPLNPNYQQGVTDVPNSGPGTPGYAPATDITLTWSSWSQAEYEVGRARVELGVHFESSRVRSVELGRKVADKVFAKLLYLWNESEDIRAADDDDK